jgi:ribosomal protein S18 acetylase RimI-like enzyme
MTDDYVALVERGNVWVAAEDEVEGVVGLIVLRPGDGYLCVENVAVNTRRQGEGVGRRLMAFAEGHATESGLEELRLYTNEKMWENLSLYSKLGYEETGRRADGGYRRVFMRKRIPYRGPR